VFHSAAPRLADAAEEDGINVHNKVILYPNIRRVGAVAEKIGMTNIWSPYGEKLDVSVIRIHDCHVLDHSDKVVLKGYGKSQEKFIKVTLGAGTRKPWKTPDWQLDLFDRAKVAPKRALRECLVSPDHIPPIGAQIAAAHFVPGQFIDVQGTTQGKGFAGAMKRWNFAGQGASHGNSLSHRALGSTGSSQNPGRVWKGKKMHGRMGGKNKTVTLQIAKIDTKRNLLWVLGHIPGTQGGFIRVQDCFKRPFVNPKETPEFPYHDASKAATPKEGEEMLWYTPKYEDPFLVGLEG
jgi:large subunit ribosomal protein L3